MSTDFGIVSNYNRERGFGFVRGLLIGNSSDVFFHIKTVKRADPQLAARLAESPLTDIHFWYETEVTQKGTQVLAILSSEQVKRGEITDLSRHIAKVEFLWRNLSYQKASWLADVTADLAGPHRVYELNLERERLEAEEQESRKLALKELEARLADEEEKRQRQRDAKKIQEQLEDNEFQELVAEMRQFCFTHSSQVSQYIVTNRLGYKYRNISGVLQMELNGTIWNFKGGFPTKIYAMLCEELGLSNNGSRAKVRDFESFARLEERSRSK